MPIPLEKFKQALELADEQDAAFRQVEAYEMALDNEAENDALATREVATDDNELQHAPLADE